MNARGLLFLLPLTLALSTIGCESAARAEDGDAGRDAAAEPAVASGELDPRFGRGGRAEVQIGRDARLMAVGVQADGKILGVGSVKEDAGSSDVFVVARFTADGAMDPSWGTRGIVITRLGDGNHQARAVAVQPDGKVVVAGAVPEGAHYRFAVVRYDANGRLDPTFGEGGRTITGFRYGVEPSAVVVQPDGAIVVGGTASDWGDAYFALARYRPDGTLDTSYGTDGKVTTSSTGYAFAMVPQPDGGVFVAGTSMVLTGSSMGGVRYDATGKLERGFASSGRAWTRLDSESTGEALVLQPDGHLVVAGTTKAGGDVARVALARFAAGGSLDAGFGSEGKVSLPLEGERMEVHAALQPDGRIVVGTGIGEQFAVARLLADGTLDADFAAGGIARVPGGSGLFARGVLVQDGGRIVVAGYHAGGWVLVGIRG